MLIARLRGTVDEIGLDGVLIDVGGVGYPVLVSNRTRAALPAGGVDVTVLIETQLREDSVVYFGFIDRAERDWFRTLTTVQGVGGKVALNLLSVLDPERLTRAILLQDKAALMQADGVGAKLAARMLTELKDRAGAVSVAETTAQLRDASRVASPAGASGASRDAVAALVGLQFKPVEAEIAVAAAVRRLGEAAVSADLIRVALQESAR